MVSLACHWLDLTKEAARPEESERNRAGDKLNELFLLEQVREPACQRRLQSRLYAAEAQDKKRISIQNILKGKRYMIAMFLPRLPTACPDCEGQVRCCEDGSE